MKTTRPDKTSQNWFGQNKRSIGRRRGFSVVELLFVFAIAGAITTMAFLGVSTLKRDGRDKERMSDRDSIGIAIKSYQSAHHGELPVLGTNPATDQIVVDSGQILLDTSPLIAGGYLNSTEAYHDPLARDGGGNRIAYRMVDGAPGACPTINDSNSATIYYERIAPDFRQFRLSICLEAGNANTVDYET